MFKPFSCTRYTYVVPPARLLQVTGCLHKSDMQQALRGFFVNKSDKQLQEMFEVRCCRVEKLSKHGCLHNIQDLVLCVGTITSKLNHYS